MSNLFAKLKQTYQNFPISRFLGSSPKSDWPLLKYRGFLPISQLNKHFEHWVVVIFSVRLWTPAHQTVQCLDIRKDLRRLEKSLGSDLTHTHPLKVGVYVSTSGGIALRRSKLTQSQRVMNRFARRDYKLITWDPLLGNDTYTQRVAKSIHSLRYCRVAVEEGRLCFDLCRLLWSVFKFAPMVIRFSVIGSCAVSFKKRKRD